MSARRMVARDVARPGWPHPLLVEREALDRAAPAGEPGIQRDVFETSGDLLDPGDRRPDTEAPDTGR